MYSHRGRVASQARTGGVLTVLPAPLDHDPTGVHRGGTPGLAVPVHSGAPVALSLAEDEGEDTVPTASTASRSAGGASGVTTPVTAHCRFVTQGSEGESVISDDLGIVRYVRHPCGCASLREDYIRVGVVVHPGLVVTGAVGKDGPVSLGC